MTDTSIEHTGRQVDKQILSNAPAETLYRALLEPEHIVGWFADHVDGGTAVGDVQHWSFDGFPMKLPYEIMITEPGRRLVLRCEIPDKGVGIIEVLLEQEGGKTRLRFINSGFGEGAEWDEEYEGIDSGWQMALTLLREYAERHFGSPRRSVLAMQAGQFEYPDLLPLFRTAEGLAAWLTTAGEIGAVDTPVALQLRGGETLTGRVLTHTPWETALSWDEIGGVLELKAFACGGPRAICLRATGWNLDNARVEQLKTWADAAVAQLLPLVNQAPESA